MNYHRLITWMIILATVLIQSTSALSAAVNEKQPQRPRVIFDIPPIEVKGETHTVGKGEKLQTVIDTAKPGDVIILEPGAIFVGPIILPAKKGNDWITVRSAASIDCTELVPGCRPEKGVSRHLIQGDEARNSGGKQKRVRLKNRLSMRKSLPKPGHRVDPSYAHLMPTILAKSGPAIVARPGAHHYRFIGIEITPAEVDKDSIPSPVVRTIGRWTNGVDPVTEMYSDYTLVSLGDGESFIDDKPHHIIFDRCYLHGHEKHGALRGVALNSRFTAVIDSYLADFKTIGRDSQAIAGWDGPGPFKILNNYLEGAGENLIFGGSDPVIKDLVPADIEIRGNHFTKPLSWKKNSAEFQGKEWTVKNLLELKNATRVVIEGNLFEYNWHHAQTGIAILFTVRNQNGKAPWSEVSDITFANNIVRHVGGGIDILGHDDIHKSRQVRRVLIKNNLFYDVGGYWGEGRLFQLRDGTADVVIIHNTVSHTGNMVSAGDKRSHSGFIFAGNIAAHNTYGIKGSGVASGFPTLKRYFPDSIIKNNIIVGGDTQSYPDNNYFPASFERVGFIDQSRGNFRLKDSSPYNDGRNHRNKAGVNFEVLCDEINSLMRTAISASMPPQICNNRENHVHI